MTHDYSHLSKAEIQPDAAAEFRFDVLPGCPALIVLSATEANQPYMNERLRAGTRNKGRQRQIEAGKLAVRHIREQRDEDRSSFARHVVRDWKNVVDAAGKKVAFSVAECDAWLQALPTYLFDELRQFCQNPANFAELPEDVESAAKNSPSGSPTS